MCQRALAALTVAISIATSALFAQNPPLENLRKDALPVLPNGGSFVLGDFTNDGVVDVFQAPNGSSVLLVGDGSGRFTARSLALTPNVHNVALAAGDVNGDGNLDVVSANSAVFSHPAQTRLWLGDGLGNFSDATARLPVDADDSTGVLLIDVDRRNGLDIVISNRKFGSVVGQTKLYLNDGLGNFSDATLANLPKHDDETNHIHALDVDADGDLDLFLANGSYVPQSNRLWLNNGSGVFSDASGVWLDGRRDLTSGVVAIDVDRDSRLDLIEINDNDALTGQTSRVLLQRNGRFSTGHGLLPATDSKFVPPLAADFDGDGDLDVLVRTQLWRNDNGIFRDVSSAWFGTLQFSFYRFAVADLDRDGDVDLVSQNAANVGPLLQVSLNDNLSGFVNACGGAMPESNTRGSAVAADLNGDGLLDLAVATGAESGEGRRLFLQTANGFLDRTSLLPTSTAQGAFVDVLHVDMDGDKDQDLVFVGRGRPHEVVLQDKGRFLDGSALLPGIVGPATSIASGDVDGDGRDDLVLGYEGQSDVILMAQASGRGFRDETSTRLPQRSDLTRDVVLVDIDKDGDLDLVCACGTRTTMERTRVYENDSRGHFTDITDAVMVSFRSAFSALVAGDFDADGDADLAVYDEAPGRMWLWANAGAGSFGLRPISLPVSTQNLDAADMDGDGDIDIVLDGLVLLNGGALTFQPFVTRANAAVVADIDADGDLDTADGSGLSSNLWRHVFGTRLAQVGRPYGIAIFAENGFGTTPPVRTAALFVGTPLTTGIPTSFGSFRLDLGSVIFAGAFQVQGRLDVTLQIPNDVALIGMDLASQALVLHGTTPSTWRLTNVWADRILR